MRRSLYETLTTLLTPAAVRTSTTPSKLTYPITVVGALSAPSGLGEMARLLLRGALALGGPVHAVDVSASLMQSSIVPQPDLPPAIEGPGTILLAVQPPSVAHILMVLGRSVLKDKLLIGFWAWELEILPASWVKQARLVHAIAAPSLFCRDAFAKAFRREVAVLPLPIANTRVRVRPPRSGAITFGAALDLGSTAARKNPMGIITAFRRAFESGTDVRLKLKIRDSHADHSCMAAIQDFIESYGTAIELETADLSVEAMDVWWEDIDVLISLHRAEGFGLWPAEAMLRKIPVISTDWSATKEFISVDNGWPVAATMIPVDDPSGRYGLAGALWAEADPEAAAHAMRMATSRAEIEVKGERARNTILQRFSAATFERHLLQTPFAA